MEEKAIPVTPEVSSPPKKKAKRSPKLVSETPILLPDLPIQGHPASELGSPLPVEASLGRDAPAYNWDRTVAERAQKEERERAMRLPFPSPPVTTGTFDQMCAYWNELCKSQVSSFAKLYLSRWWPVLLPVATTDDFGNQKESFPNDLIITPTDGELGERLILQLAGVGEYRFRLNDTRRPWKQQTVMFSELNVIEQSLWNLHPPILDYKRLDLDAKRNQVYIKFARSHGYLPREGEIEQEKDDMANAEVVTQLLQANKSLTDQVLKGPAPPAPVPIPVKVETNGNGDGGAVKAMADVAIAIMSREQPAPADPIQMVQSMVGMLKEITPKPDTSATDLAKVVVEAKQKADDRAYELQKEQLTQMRAELKEARTAINPTQVLPPRTRKEMLEDAVAEQTLLRTLAGGRAPRTEEEPEKPGFIDKWGEVLPALAQPVSAFLQGLFQTIQFGFHSYQVASYNNALGKNGGAPMQPMSMNNPQSQPPQAGQPMAPQGPAPTPQQSEQEQVFSTIMSGVIKMSPYLVKHLDKGKSGAEFAEFIIENGEEERTTYDRIRALPEALSKIGIQVPGKDEEQFLNACRFVFEKYPPLWQKVGNHPTVKQFLTEFYSYDQIVAEQTEAEKGEQK